MVVLLPSYAGASDATAVEVSLLDVRRQVVLDQCQFTDGQSAERVTALVLDELGTAKARVAA